MSYGAILTLRRNTMDDLEQYKPVRWEDLSRNLDYDYLEHERRAKLSHDAAFGGAGSVSWKPKHGQECPCRYCGLDRALAKLSAADKPR